MKSNVTALFLSAMFTVMVMFSIKFALSQYLAVDIPRRETLLVPALGFLGMAWVFFWMFRAVFDANDRINFLMKHIKRLNDQIETLEKKVAAEK